MKITVTVWAFVNGVSRPLCIVAERDCVQIEEHILTWTGEGLLSAVEVVCADGHKPDQGVSALVAAYFVPR